MEHARGRRDPRRTTIIVIASILLSVCYVAAGYLACAQLPFVTQAVAGAVIDDDGSPFDVSQLSRSADAVRDYSFGRHDLDSLMEVVSDINDDAETPYAAVTPEDLVDAPYQYSITTDQVSHLDDVNAIAQRAVLPIFGSLVTAIFLLMVGYRMFGMRAVSRSLMYGGFIAMALIVAIALFGAVAFDAFFSIFHSVLFSQGNWTFPGDSLLIMSLPEPFWETMGIIWAAITFFLGAVSLIVGILLRRGHRN